MANELTDLKKKISNAQRAYRKESRAMRSLTQTMYYKRKLWTLEDALASAGVVDPARVTTVEPYPPYVPGQ